MDARLTHHARERCAEMGISTKVAKAIVRKPSLTRPAGDGRTMATNDACPDYAVVYYADVQPPVIVSVVFRTEEEYVRDGATYVPKGEQ